MKPTFVLVVFLLFFGSSLSAQNSIAKIDSTNIQTTENNGGVIGKIEHWYKDNTNYTTIVALMTIESSFIPFPSEIVIPPAAYVASKPDSHLNIFLVVVFGTLGSLLGALINYFLAMYLGRALVYKFADSKFGRLCTLSSEKIQKSEQFFNEKGNISTFVGRLIPGIRQLISIPAGLAKMRLPDFILYTTLGALIWNSILAFVGYIAQGQENTIHKYSSELSYLVLAIGVLAVLFFIFKKLRKSKES